MFEEQPTARADLNPGTLYAITGECGWVYYGQVTSQKKIGFFRRRDREVAEANAVLASPIMSVVSVVYPSIGRALRSGYWKKLGRLPVVDGLIEPRPSVQWSVGTLTVWIIGGGKEEWETSVDDPKIQNMELAAAWDAEFHIPARLTADFGEEKAEWNVGGPIHRERRIKEEFAARFPDQPQHSLPANWITTAGK